MSKINTDAEKAIQDAFERTIGLMYDVLLGAIVTSNGNAELDEAACKRFKHGVTIAGRARDVALKLVSE